MRPLSSCFALVKVTRVYQIENSGQILRRGDQKSPGKRPRLTKPRVSATVFLLGLTSLVTDVSAEMVASVLPLYLVLSVGLSPLAFGVIDGLYLGGAAIVRLFSGFLADRSGNHKEIATTGYALSAVSRLGMLLVGGTWALLAGVILADRLGKGIRTAPRDAMISLTSPPEKLATAFGVHRAMDTAGAMMGPLIAFGILTLSSTAYDAIFIVSLCFAVIGVAIIGLFVRNPAPPAANNNIAAPAPSIRRALGLVRDSRFAPLLLVGGVLSLMTMSDGFVYLTLQRQIEFRVGYFPLLYVATALIFMLLAIPMGQLADRIGRGRVFVGGYAVLMAVYALLIFPGDGLAHVLVSLLLLGIYYAATDGVLMAMGSAILPEDLRASGLALLTTITNIGRMGASILFGSLWTWQGLSAAVWVFIAGLFASTLISAWLFASPRFRITSNGQ